MVLNCLLLNQNDWWMGLKTKEDFHQAAKTLTVSFRAALQKEEG